MKETRESVVNRGEKYNRIVDRAKIFCTAVSLERLSEISQDMPYEMHSDVAVVFYLQDRQEERNVIIPVTHEVVEELELGYDQLVRVAWRNTVRKKKAVLMPLADLLGELPEPGMPELYVLSNEDMHLGAVTMFYPGLLAMIANRFNRDLCILPSSIHECLLMPVTPDTDMHALKEIVKRVNDTEVDKDDILSYSVYRYNRKKECIERQF